MRSFVSTVSMSVEKRLAFSIVQFLREQTHQGSLSSDEQESLEGMPASPLSYSHKRCGKQLV